jgi:hypothetical protein
MNTPKPALQIPDISDERLKELADRIRPLVGFDEDGIPCGLYHEFSCY